MNTIISSTSGFCYRHLLKPILFKQSPDNVHARLLRLGGHLQHSHIPTSLVRHSWAYRNTALLGQTLHGIKFDNPVGLSAGFDKNFQLPLLLKAIGFGFMEGGSITYNPCEGNPRPWFHRLPKTQSLVVHAGLANEGVTVIINRLRQYPASALRNFPLNVSVAKTNSPEVCSEEDAIDDYIGSLRALKKTGTGDLITLNISCPNTFGGEPFTTPDRLEHLLTAVDAVHLQQPIFVKMPINLEWSAFDKLLRVIVKHRVAGVTIGNLNKDRRHIRLSDPLPDTIPGGLSGKPTAALSNVLIAKTYRRYGDKLTIIGVGGIFSAEDAYTKIRLGASMVELITGMIFEGPQLVGQINRDLAAILQKDGYANVSEAVGADQRY